MSLIVACSMASWELPLKVLDNAVLYKCIFPSCQKRFGYSLALHQHLLSHQRDCCSCSKCDIVFPTQDEYFVHLKSPTHKNRRAASSFSTLSSLPTALNNLQPAIQVSIQQFQNAVAAAAQNRADLDPNIALLNDVVEDELIHTDQTDDEMDDEEDGLNLHHLEQLKRYLQMEPKLTKPVNVADLLLRLIALKENSLFPYDSQDTVDVLHLVSAVQYQKSMLIFALQFDLHPASEKAKADWLSFLQRKNCEVPATLYELDKFAMLVPNLVCILDCFIAESEICDVVARGSGME